MRRRPTVASASRTPSVRRCRASQPHGGQEPSAPPARQARAPRPACGWGQETNSCSLHVLSVDAADKLSSAGQIEPEPPREPGTCRDHGGHGEKSDAQWDRTEIDKVEPPEVEAEADAFRKRRVACAHSRRWRGARQIGDVRWHGRYRASVVTTNGEESQSSRCPGRAGFPDAMRLWEISTSTGGS